MEGIATMAGYRNMFKGARQAMQGLQGMVRPRKGVVGVQPDQKRSKKARRPIRVPDGQWVLHYPVGVRNRTGAFGTAAYWGAIPTLPFAVNTPFFEWDPARCVVGYEQATSAATFAIADFDTESLMPYHESYTGVVSPPTACRVGTYAGPGVGMLDTSEIQDMFNDLRMDGTAAMCTLQLDLSFIPYPDNTDEHRVRVLMIQILEETDDNIGVNGYTIDDFIQFPVAESGTMCYFDLNLNKRPGIHKDPAEAEANVPYRVLVDQIIELRNSTTTLDRPTLRLRQPMGIVPYADGIDYQTNQLTTAVNRDGRIIWGIFELNHSGFSSAGEPTSGYNPHMMTQWYGMWKCLWNKVPESKR